MATDPELVAAAHAFSRAGNIRTVLAVPLLLKGHPIGGITLARTRVAPFDDKQVALVESFVDQAVIAIENSRLFDEVQARTQELQESLEYQTAMSEVLSVISRSPSRVQPVLDTIVETAARLCYAEHATAFRLQDFQCFLAATKQHDPAFAKYLADHPMVVDASSATGRAVLERRAIHIPDILADPTYTSLVGQLANTRTILSVPLVREGMPIGVLTMGRTMAQPFSEKQVELLETFADQAVIAIENTRLFEAEQASKRELTEALEQQTATADVLKVISRSALDVQKVLDALVESAARLCGAQDSGIFQVFGDGMRLVAHYGQLPMSGRIGQLTRPLMRGTFAGRAVIDRRAIQVADILAEADEYPESHRTALQLGYRTALGVPLVHAARQSA